MDTSVELEHVYEFAEQLPSHQVQLLEDAECVHAEPLAQELEELAV